MTIPVPSVRRNGKKPSCEPCRTSKYSCDHAMPVCARCERRGIASRCTYHPAPMKGLTPRKLNRSVLQPRRPHARRETHQCAPPLVRETLQPPNRLLTSAEPGFLGSTSYNAVLQENEDHIDGLEANLGGSDSTPLPPISERLKEATSVLDLLLDFDHLERIVQRCADTDRCLSASGSNAVRFGKAIRELLIERGVNECSNAERLGYAQMLCRSTAEKLRITKTTKFSEYVDFFIYPSIRWEALGIFFTACGLYCSHMTCDEREFDFVGNRECDRQALMYRLLEASNACLTFCEETGPLTDMAVWFTLENCIFASQVLGDAHYLVWRKAGDLSTAIFAHGLHQQGKRTSDMPFWLMEMSRRALGTAYRLDKLLCTFVGRPPRISKRYCSIVPPLDLELSELALEGPELEWALANIDEHGWNRTGSCRRSVWQRCAVLNALLREEVLELSLGPNQEGLLEISEDLIRRTHELLESLPEKIKYTGQMWRDKDPATAFLVSQEYLDIAYNDFMLRRLRAARLGKDHTELLRISHKILVAVLDGVQMQGNRNNHGACVAWIVVLYGLPTAAVLALELLQQKQSQLRNDYPPRSEAFPSSKIIQDLSVFIATLRYVHTPGDGNYTLAEQARKSLQRILDKTLSIEAVPMPAGVQLPSPTSVADPSEDNENPMFDFGWIDNTQFDTDFWLSLPDHPLLT